MEELGVSLTKKRQLMRANAAADKAVADKEASDKEAQAADDKAAKEDADLSSETNEGQRRSTKVNEKEQDENVACE
jgi:hypothetical protein